MAGTSSGRTTRQAGLLAGLAVCLLLTGLRWLDPAPLKDLRDATLDVYQQMQPRSSGETPVAIVVIDDDSLKEIGQWPWPRRRMADLADRLFGLGAASVAFDVLFSEPDRFSPGVLSRELGNGQAALQGLPDGDAELARALSGRPTVLAFAASDGAGDLPEPKGGLAITGEDVSGSLPRLAAAVRPVPELEAAAAGLGHISISTRQIGSRVREVPLFLSGGGTLFPAFSLEALRVALGASTYVVKGADFHAGAMESVRVGDSVIPVTEAGTLRFYAAPGKVVPSVSARQILAGAELPPKQRAMLEGAIVLIGVSAPGLQDIRITPLGEAVPGVAIHAQIIQQILNGEFLQRPAWAGGAEIIAVAGLSLLLVAIIWFFGPLMGLAAAGGALVLGMTGSWYLFTRQSLLVDPLAPLGAAFLTVFAATAFWYLASERERRYIREAFGRYVSPAVLARIEKSPDALRLGGVNRDITVLFMDIRNFTPLSETLTPQETVRFLNTLHGALSEPVLESEGTIDKYIGDSIMAFWNAPLDVEDHPKRAAQAALGMSAALAELNRNDAFGLGPDRPVSIGIGINTGIACVGNMGTLRRLNYSAVGDTVNTAARIESACKEAGAEILLSEETASRLTGFRTRFAGNINLKGKSAAKRVFALEGPEVATPS
jgi:adenylate cyclase